MKITVGTIEHIRQLAISRQDGGLSAAGNVELFDSIDCLDLDELSELYAIVCVGQSGTVGLYGAAIDEARVLGADAAEHLLALSELGALLTAGKAQLKLG